jgi:hypothetical protein
MTLYQLLELVFTAGATYGAVRVEMRSLKRRIRAIEKHQEMQSGRLWSLARE